MELLLHYVKFSFVRMYLVGLVKTDPVQFKGVSAETFKRQTCPFLSQVCLLKAHVYKPKGSFLPTRIDRRGFPCSFGTLLANFLEGHLLGRERGTARRGTNREILQKRGKTRSYFVWSPAIGRTPRGSCNRALLRRVLRSFFKGSAFLEGFLEGTL